MPKQLKPIRPSAAIRIAYQQRLDRELEAMHKSIAYWVLATYRQNQPEIAQDESPARALRGEIRRRARIWRFRFNELSQSLAEHFAKNVNQRASGALSKMLADAGFTHNFKMTAAMNDVMQATIQAQVGLIKSISEKHLSDVEGAVMRSVQTGRDIGGLAKELQQTYGVTKRRAALIARHQNNIATASMLNARYKEVGITTAKWHHSSGGKYPRKSHVDFSGKQYTIAKGAYIDGEWIYPGQLINCRCVSIPIIERLDS